MMKKEKTEDVNMSIFDGTPVSGPSCEMSTDGIDYSIFDTTGSGATVIDDGKPEANNVELPVVSWKLLVETFGRAKEKNQEIDDCVVVLSKSDGRVFAKLGFGNANEQIEKPDGIEDCYFGCRFDDRLSLLMNHKDKVIVEL